MENQNDDFNWLRMILGILFVIGIVFLITMDNDDYTPFSEHSFSYKIGYFLGGCAFIVLLMNYERFK